MVRVSRRNWSDMWTGSSAIGRISQALGDCDAFRTWVLKYTSNHQEYKEACILARRKPSVKRDAFDDLFELGTAQGGAIPSLPSVHTSTGLNPPKPARNQPTKMQRTSALVVSSSSHKWFK